MHKIKVIKPARNFFRRELFILNNVSNYQKEKPYTWVKMTQLYISHNKWAKRKKKKKTNSVTPEDCKEINSVFMKYLSFLDPNMIHKKKKWQPTPKVFPGKHHKQYAKAKINDPRQWAPQVIRCQTCYCGRVEGNYYWLQKEWSSWAKAEINLCCEFVW